MSSSCFFRASASAYSRLISSAVAPYIAFTPFTLFASWFKTPSSSLMRPWISLRYGKNNRRKDEEWVRS